LQEFAKVLWPLKQEISYTRTAQFCFNTPPGPPNLRDTPSTQYEKTSRSRCRPPRAGLSRSRQHPLFEVQAVALSPSFNHTEGYASFPDLVADLIQNQGNFSPLLSSNSFFADITFLGMPNALQVNYTATLTTITATIQSPVSGLNRTLTGPTWANVEQQIKDYFLNNGSAADSDFLSATTRRSAVAVTDGTCV
jgi:hypothetical protein